MTDRVVRFSPINPETVGMISLVEIPDKEIILRDRMLKVKERWEFYDPPYGAIYDVERTEFDPGKIVMESGTASEINALSRINYMGKVTSLLYAEGEDLDVVGSRYPNGVPRLNKGLINQETDERYRYRLWLSSNAYSTAGAKLAYIFHAMTAVPELRDVTVTVERADLYTQPILVVTCQAEKKWQYGTEFAYSPTQPINPDTGLAYTFVDDTPIPTDDQLLRVQIRLSDESVGPPTDVISVRPPELITTPYDVGIWVLPFSDHDAAKTAVEQALDKTIEEQRYLGIDYTSFAVDRAAGQIGVQDVEIAAPVPPRIAIADTQLAVVSSRTVTILGERS